MQKVLQERVTDRKVVKEDYSETHKTVPTRFEKPTFTGKKTGEQLYGPQWRERIRQMVQQRGPAPP